MNITKTTRPVFEPHYRITVQAENLDNETADKVEPVILPAPTRLPLADILAVRVACGVANKLTVGAQGRCEFNGYTVYVNYVPSMCQSELLATVRRQYSRDNDADYTYAGAHAGRMTQAAVDQASGYVAPTE
jgi:hypothetical protein